MLKKIEAICIWGQLFGCCFLVLSVISASKIYPEGNTDNRLITFLLKHVTIQTAIEDDRWSIEYPFDENYVDYYLSSVGKVEKAIENYCTTSFPGGGIINGIVTGYKDMVMHYHVSSISSIDDNQQYISGCVDNVLEFKDEVNALGIPFFYVQTPSQAGIDYYNDATLVGDALNIAERSYCLTTSLEDNGVDVVNIARDYSKEITFDASSHWKPTDGLKCADIIAGKLVDDYNFDIDLSVYASSNFYDYAEGYQEFKSTVRDTLGYDFIVPCPNFSTNIKRVYAEEIESEGAFQNVIFREPNEWNLEGGAYHDVFTISNSLINTLHNENASCNKKVLIIGDSFNWPVGSYLSLVCKDVTIIHNASFTGSLISYITTMEPDIVIMVYNDAEFYEIYTQDAYYLK